MSLVRIKSWTTELAEEDRRKAVELARKYLGTPWRHQGRSANGVDCVGLLFVVIKELTKADIEFTGYSRWPNPSLLRENLRKYLIVIKRDDLTLGDMVLLKSGGAVCHTGFYAGNTLIHADVFARKVIEHRLDSEWKRNIMGCYRIPEYIDG